MWLQKHSRYPLWPSRRRGAWPATLRAIRRSVCFVVQRLRAAVGRELALRIGERDGTHMLVFLGPEQIDMLPAVIFRVSIFGDHFRQATGAVTVPCRAVSKGLGQ